MSDSENTNDTPERYVKHPGGRPTLLTEELIDDFCKLLPTMMYMDSISDMLGISRITWRNWIKRGRAEADRMEREGTDLCAESEALCVKFFYRHKAALALGEFKDNENIVAAANAGQYQASIWRLGVRRPNVYGPQARELRISEKQGMALKERLDLMEQQVSEVPTLRAEVQAKDAEIERLKALLAQSTTPDHVIGR